MVTHAVSGECAQILRFDGEYVVVCLESGRVECWSEEYCLGLE